MPDTIRFTVRGDTYKACHDAAETEVARLLSGWEDQLGYDHIPPHTLELAMHQDSLVHNQAEEVVMRTYSATVQVSLWERKAESDGRWDCPVCGQTFPVLR